MNDTRNLPFEIRHLREAIELLSETVADAVTVVAKITKERQRIELALKSQKNVSKHDPVMWSKPDLSLEDLRNAIAMQWCVTIDQLCSARRGRELTAPRFAFCHIAHTRLQKFQWRLTIRITQPSCTAANALTTCLRQTKIFNQITKPCGLQFKQVKRQRLRSNTDGFLD